jgi:citrate synthase
MPGFGHWLHTKDPRTARLFELAREAGVGGMHMQAGRAVEKAFAAATKSLPINVDGAIGAIFADLGMNPPPSTAFFMIARLPGLVAHVIEEQTRENQCAASIRSITATTGCQPEGFLVSRQLSWRGRALIPRGGRIGLRSYR